MGNIFLTDVHSLSMEVMILLSNSNLIMYCLLFTLNGMEYTYFLL